MLCGTTGTYQKSGLLQFVSQRTTQHATYIAPTTNLGASAAVAAAAVAAATLATAAAVPASQTTAIAASPASTTVAAVTMLFNLDKCYSCVPQSPTVAFPGA